MYRSMNVLRSVFVASVAVFVVSLFAEEAHAAKAKSTQTEANWIAFDSETNTVKVKVRKSKGPNKKKLKRGKEAVFNVIPEGSILTRTSVAINGVKGELTDIPAGKQVNIYWVPDPKKDGEYFARKIDVVLSDEELDARAAIQ